MTVEYRRRGRVAVVSINRPEVRNAVDRETAAALNEAWHRFEDDEEADVGVLWGEGGHFSSGADLKAFDLVDTPSGLLGFTRMAVSKPTIAAIEGYCVAGGLEMALWCDIRVAGTSAVLGCFERRFGVPLGDGGTQRLPAVIGVGLALELILTGRPVSADEAHAIGLVNTVVADGSALEEAVKLADAISRHPQATVRSDRMAVLEGIGLPLDEGLAIERRHARTVRDLAARGAERFAVGAGRSGTAVREEEPVVEEDEAVAVAVVPVPEPEPVAVEDVHEAEEVTEVRPASDVHVPSSGAGRPILLLHDRWGLTERTDVIVERLVRLGHVVYALDLFGGFRPSSPEEADAAVAKLDADLALDMVESAVGRLLSHGSSLGSRVAIVGLGEGAGLAMSASTVDSRIAAVVGFSPIFPWDDVQPSYRLAAASYLGHVGGADERARPEQSIHFETHLRDMGLDATFHVYRGAHHDFYLEGSRHHAEAFANLAWQRTKLFLARAY